MKDSEKVLAETENNICALNIHSCEASMIFLDIGNHIQWCDQEFFLLVGRGGAEQFAYKLVSLKHKHKLYASLQMLLYLGQKHKLVKIIPVFYFNILYIRKRASTVSIVTRFQTR